MATDRQIAANRANAQRSTGPKTAAGRGVSRYNALKHGLSAQSVLITGEYPHQFEEMRQRIYNEYNPQSVVEEQLVEKLAMDLWRLRRIPGLESAVYHWFSGDVAEIRNGYMSSQETSSSTDSDDFHYGVNDAANGYALMKMAQLGDMLGKLNRHEAQLLRQVKQLLAELKDMRAERARDAASAG
jgi:hypothetical protein